MAQPKKKTSHTKQQQRRAKNYLGILKTTTLTTCTNCGQPVRPHQACVECGFYRGRPARRKDSLTSE